MRRLAGEPPRVLHAIDALRVGGAEALTAAMVEELAREGLARNALCAFSEDASDAKLVAQVRAGCETAVLLPHSRVYDPRLTAGVLRLALRFRADVIHSHLSAATVTSRLAAALLRRPHVTTVHTMPGPAAHDNRPRRWAVSATARLSARLVAPSEEIAAACATAWRLPRSRFEVVPNAPATPPPPAGFDRAAARRALIGDHDGPIVLCVARLMREKAIDDLVRAAALVRPAVPGLRVLVAGDGPRRAALEAQIDAEGAGETVRLLGHRSDVGALLAAADAFCLPSRHEGVPLTLLEAMRAGLPCVVTTVGGIPDVVRDGETALLVEPSAPEQLAEALARVLSAGALAERLGSAARARQAADFSLESVARRYAALYGELLRNGRRAAVTSR
jgi:glycosyltransferase involved in cell wall biosynthesis